MVEPKGFVYTRIIDGRAKFIFVGRLVDIPDDIRYVRECSLKRLLQRANDGSFTQFAGYEIEDTNNYQERLKEQDRKCAICQLKKKLSSYRPLSQFPESTWSVMQKL